MADTQYLIGKETLDSIANRIIATDSTFSTLSPEQMITCLDKLLTDMLTLDTRVDNILSNATRHAVVLTPTCSITDDRVLIMKHNGINVDFTNGYFKLTINADSNTILTEPNYTSYKYDLFSVCSDPTKVYTIEVASFGRSYTGDVVSTTDTSNEPMSHAVIAYTPKVYAPIIALNRNILTITPSEGLTPDKYKLYYTDTKYNKQSAVINALKVDLQSLITVVDVYEVHVVSCVGSAESAPSNELTWTNIVSNIPENKTIVVTPNTSYEIIPSWGVKELNSYTVNIYYESDGEENTSDLSVELSNNMLVLTHANQGNLICPVYELELNYTNLVEEDITEKLYVCATTDIRYPDSGDLATYAITTEENYHRWSDDSGIITTDISSHYFDAGVAPTEYYTTSDSVELEYDENIDAGGSSGSNFTVNGCYINNIKRVISGNIIVFGELTEESGTIVKHDDGSIIEEDVDTSTSITCFVVRYTEDSRL